MARSVGILLCILGVLQLSSGFRLKFHWMSSVDVRPGEGHAQNHAEKSETSTSDTASDTASDAAGSLTTSSIALRGAIVTGGAPTTEAAANGPITANTTAGAGASAEGHTSVGLATNISAGAATATLQAPVSPQFLQMMGAASANGLIYKNGTVMADPIPVYVLFYGNWSLLTCGPRVIYELINSISDPLLSVQPGQTLPGWWRVVTKYMQKDGRTVSPIIRAAGYAIDNYSQGPNLTHSMDANSPWGVLRAAFVNGTLPVDPNAQYLVLTSEDVMVTNGRFGFCVSYCGWHSMAGFNGTTIIYSFVGDGSTQCPGTTCAMKMGRGPDSPTPNLCPQADVMVSTIMHELAEMATNPVFNGWTKDNGWLEVADVCQRNYTIGAQWTQNDTALYNLAGRGGLKFLAQSVYDPVLGQCSQSA